MLMEGLRGYRDVSGELDHRGGPGGSVNSVQDATQGELAAAFEQEQEHGESPRNGSNWLLSVRIDDKTTSIPTTLSGPDKSPSNFMKVDFKHPDFKKLYSKADTQYQQELEQTSGVTKEGALKLRLQTRNQVLRDAYPTDSNTMRDYHTVHGELNNRSPGQEQQAPQLSDYFSEGAPVCIQIASLTSYYLYQHGIEHNLCIQELPTADGRREYHAYISLRDLKMAYDPTNSPTEIDEQGEKKLGVNLAQDAYDLLLYRSRNVKDNTSAELAKAFGSNNYALAA